MYKKDYHPDTDLIFKTKNYGFDSPKSVPLEPVSNALVQIDTALKKEETERIKEDVRINGRVDKEITDREAEDIKINNRVDKEIADRENADSEILKKCMKVSSHYIKVGYENTEKVMIPCFSAETLYYALFFITAPSNADKYIIGIPTFAKNIAIPSIVMRQGDTLLPFQFLRATELDDAEFYYYRSYGTIIPDNTGYRASLVINFTS